MAASYIRNRADVAMTFGDDLRKAVVKATNLDIVTPKEKHVRRLIGTSFNAQLLPELIQGLLVRVKDKSWIVVLKALIVVHRIFKEGGGGFLEAMARNPSALNLANFRDNSNPDAFTQTLLIRSYARYLEEKVAVFRELHYEHEKATPNSKATPIRTLPLERVLRDMPAIQRQFDVLLDIKPGDDLNNEASVTAFKLCMHDGLRLFHTLNDGCINLIEKFFDMQKEHAKAAFNIYKKFVRQTGDLQENIAATRRVRALSTTDWPDLSQPPPGLMAAMEEFLRDDDDGTPDVSALIGQGAAHAVDTATAARAATATTTTYGGGLTAMEAPTRSARSRTSPGRSPTRPAGRTSPAASPAPAAAARRGAPVAAAVGAPPPTLAPAPPAPSLEALLAWSDDSDDEPPAPPAQGGGGGGGSLFEIDGIDFSISSSPQQPPAPAPGGWGGQPAGAGAGGWPAPAGGGQNGWPAAAPPPAGTHAGGGSWPSPQPPAGPPASAPLIAVPQQMDRGYGAKEKSVLELFATPTPAPSAVASGTWQQQQAGAGGGWGSPAPSGAGGGGGGGGWPAPADGRGVMDDPFGLPPALAGGAVMQPQPARGASAQQPKKKDAFDFGDIMGTM